MKYKCTSIPLQSDPYHPGAQEQVHVALFKDPEFWQVALHTINKILKFCSYYVLIVNVIAILVPKLHNSDCSKERSLPSQVCTKNYIAYEEPSTNMLWTFFPIILGQQFFHLPKRTCSLEVAA